MNLSLTRVAAIAAVLFASTSVANAAFIQWNIDPAQSKVTLGIPDQVINLDGTVGTVRVRNQTGSSNTWNLGNSAGVDGFLNSYYRETANSGVHDLQFTSNPVGQVFGLTSGNYRPNPARYSTTATNTTNPDGQFTGSNASDFPAVFAAKIRASVSILTVDLLFLNFFNTSFDATSNVMPVSGTTGGSFNPIAGGLQMGIANSGLAVDGLSALIVGQVVPDTLDTFGPELGPPTVVTTATVTDLGGQNRRLNLTVSSALNTDLGGTPVLINVSATFVAFAIVPEPSTMMMAGVGLVGLAACARRKYSKR